MTGGGTNAKEIFLAALDVEPAAREAYLRAACDGDVSLRARVDRLLAAHGESTELDAWLGRGVDVDPFASVDGANGNGGDAASDSLGDYELLDEVASGAMGTVYRARQRSLDRIVALKVLRVGRFATDEEVRRFRAEAEAVARLDHPNIVPVYDVGASDGRNFFSMKLIDGPGLDAQVDSFRDDPRRAASLVACVARGVHHAHQHGLLHRDLKPSNILVDGEGTPHIADFGVAKRVDDNAFETHPGQIIGTPAYMAPEQLTEDGEITVRTDVYSLGCVLYELLSGRPPFLGKSIADVFQHVRETEATPLTSRNARVPNDLALICHKCLAKDPERRYGSTLALADDLERWLDHVPIHARPTSLFERAALYWRRKPLQASLMATVTMLVITLAIGATTASFVMRAYLNRAVDAEGEAKERLRSSLLAQARANLRARRPGRRYESLALLEQAAQIEPGADLRDEAVKAMTLTDLGVLHEWSFPAGQRLAFSSYEHELVLIASDDGAASVRTFDGDVVFERPGDGANVWGGAFSPDGRTVVLKLDGGQGDFVAHCEVWSVAQGEPVATISRSPPARSLAFHPSGEALLIGSGRGDLAAFDTRTLETRAWGDFSDSVHGIRFRPDGDEVAIDFREEPAIEIRGYPDGELRRRFEFDFDPMSLDWSPDGGRLLAGGADSVAYVLDAMTGATLATLAGHQAEIVDAFFLQDELGVTNSWDETTRLWDLRTGSTLIVSDDTVNGRSLDRTRIGFVTRGRGGVWSVDHADFLRVLHAHVLKGPRWVDVSPSGKWMVSGGDDDALLWDLEGERLLGSLGTGAVGALMFARERDDLYVSTARGLLRWSFAGVSDVDVALDVEPQVVFDDVTYRFDFDATESVVVVNEGSEVRFRALGDPSRDRVLATTRGANQPVLSPDGRWAALSSWRGHGVRVWDTTTGELVTELDPEFAETTAAFSPDGKRIITGTPNRYSSHVVGTWELEYRLDRGRLPTNLPGTIEFDASGALVALASTSRALWLVDAATGERLLGLDGIDSYQLTRLSFLPGNRGIVAGTSGRRVLLWRLERVADELRARGLAAGLEPDTLPSTR